jgi:hypothetical protein
LQERNAEITAELSQLQAVNQKARDKLKELTEQPSPLKLMQSRRSDFLTDIETFNKLISKITDHVKHMQARHDQCVQEKRQAEARLATAQQEQARLQVLNFSCVYMLCGVVVEAAACLRA